MAVPCGISSNNAQQSPAPQTGVFHGSAIQNNAQPNTAGWPSFISQINFMHFYAIMCFRKLSHTLSSEKAGFCKF